MQHPYFCVSVSVYVVLGIILCCGVIVRLVVHVDKIQTHDYMRTHN